MDGFAILALDPEYIGACPCASIEVDGARLELHCWRVDMGHDGCGIHYEGPEGRAAARKVKPALDAMDWYGRWEIVEGFRP